MAVAVSVRAGRLRELAAKRWVRFAIIIERREMWSRFEILMLVPMGVLLIMRIARLSVLSRGSRRQDYGREAVGVRTL